MCFGDTLACGAPRSEDAGGVFSFGGAGRLLAGSWRAACSASGLYCRHYAPLPLYPVRRRGQGVNRPVLKHGPRSPPRARAVGRQTLWRNESKAVEGAGGNPYPCKRCRSCLHKRLDLSKSAGGGTRKMVSYTWAGRSQKKFWWRPAAILTCKSIVKPEYRGERLIELSSSWFPSKFPSG